MELWKQTPGMCQEIPTITWYEPTERKSDGAIVIFPGGGYGGRADYEGAGYAEFLSAAGIPAFSVDYRVAPHAFPLPLLDARRAVRWVRAHAAEFGLDPQKIAVMGSSAGGHLAALTATYAGTLSDEDIDEIDREDSRPNAQILCYPVIVAPDAEGIAHAGSYENLLGGTDPVREAQLDPARLATEQTPPAFIWHTANDNCVNVINSYRYAEALRRHNVDTEMHIFPHGPHGMALAQGEPHVGQWTGLLFNWLAYIGWMK